MRIGPLDEEQRGAIAELFGLARAPGGFASITVSKLDSVLVDTVGIGAYQVVEQLVGPIEDRAEQRRVAATERDELWRWLSDHPVVRAQPALETWVTAMQRSGLIDGSVQRTRGELELALRVVRELPGAGKPLPVFAQEVLDRPHGLDDGTRLHTMVVRALSAIHDVEPPSDAWQVRALWERAGVTADELSSTVLVAGMRCAGEDSVSRVLNIGAESGEAASLTLRQLRSVPALAPAPRRVTVVENPSVLALALHRFDDRCPPLVCISGWPSGAGVLLMQHLSDAGVRLRYHGDLDGEGLRIAAHVVARVGAEPWHMSSADYLAAVGRGPSVGRVTPVPWDAELAEHMVSHGTAVSEERVAEQLLDELAADR
ncbi:TIGR02679 family protein [Nocardia sp. BMG51109]|uniref:TIGR02679 family protein n=1 Tax=Nocardia sp. BMG51109 TaxID=1056816 RepID=UPI0018DEB8DD|nr:TIGR02679 family protein [Nocardia sp. BMG51109]